MPAGSSAVRAEVGQAAPRRVGPPARDSWWRRDRWLVAACLIVAAVSLVRPWALAYDPDAWVVWGREITRFTLDTSAGPSWKPFPVVFTAPFALTGDAAPALWLIVARAGGLLALAGAARLAFRLGGPLAAAGAAGAIALSPWWWFNTALGNSEGLLVASILWAALAHLDGRQRRAFLLGLPAALLRPEVWPFLLLYAAWLWRTRPGECRTIAGGLAVLGVLWLGPDALGSGGALQASDAARGVFSEESAAHADVPGLEVLRDAVELVTVPALLAAAAALLRPARPIVWLAAGAVAWVVLVAVLTQAGYAGNPRYLVPAAAVGAVLAGVGAARLVGLLAAHPFPSWLPVAALVGAIAALQAGDLRDQTDRLGERAAIREELVRLIERAGGAERIRACAPARTIASMRSPVAWELDVKMSDVGGSPRPPAALFRLAGQPTLSPADRAALRLAARDGQWELWTVCRFGV